MTEALNGMMAGSRDGTHGSRVGSLNSNSETHINARYDARLIYGRGGYHRYL